MSQLLDSQNQLKRRVLLAIFSFNLIGATIATLFHHLEPHPSWINLIAPPLLAITSLVLLIWLYQVPSSLQRVMHLSLVVAILLILVPSWSFTLQAFLIPGQSLVNSFPPLTSGLFLILMVMMIGLRPRRLLIVSLLTWMAIAIPILTYLLWHPAELNSLRGRDLFITLGPAMGTQIVLILFFNRLQDLVDRLYHERVQYYEQIIERQTIRQQAMEQAVSQIHNGPLQSLALLMRDLDQDQMRSPVLRQRLADLNAEIRAVGHSLTDSSVPHSDLLPLPPDHLLRLGEGTCVDLNHPLHHLLYEVYRLTLKRHLPYFQTIKVKVRNFAPLESSELSFELKRDLCLWLEEALCNVGKHAQGTTRLVVTGQYDADQYVLQVQDNGIGCNGIGCNEVVCNPDLEQQGTKFCTLLAQRLGGTFQRTSLPTGGVLCQLAWCCGLKKLDSIDRISETEGMA